MLIARTSWPKIPLHRELPDVGVTVAHLPLRHLLGIDPDGGIESASGLLDPSLRPCADLVRVDLVALSRLGHRRSSAPASEAIFASGAASIFRLVFVVVARSDDQTKRSISTRSCFSFL